MKREIRPREIEVPNQPSSLKSEACMYDPRPVITSPVRTAITPAVSAKARKILNHRRVSGSSRIASHGSDPHDQSRDDHVGHALQCDGRRGVAGVDPVAEEHDFQRLTGDPAQRQVTEGLRRKPDAGEAEE